MPGPNGQSSMNVPHDPSTGPIPVPRKQVVYRDVYKYVIYDSTASNGNRYALVIDTPSEQVCFPMSDEEAAEIGKGLTAPHVIRPE